MDLARTEADIEARCALVDKGLKDGVYDEEEAKLRKKLFTKRKRGEGSGRGALLPGGGRITHILPDDPIRDHGLR